MKLVKIIFLILTLIFTFFVSVSMAETGIVNVSATRMREESNTNSKIIKNIYEDDEVEILDEVDNWYKVKSENDIGYVKKDYIKRNSSSTNTENTISNTVANETNSISNSLVNDNNTNLNEDTLVTKTNSKTYLRILPTLASEKIIEIESEKEVTKISEIDNWIQITDGTISGWIPKTKIEKNIKEEKNTDIQNDKEKNENLNIVNNTISNNTNNTVLNSTNNTVSNNTSVNNIENSATANNTVVSNQSTNTTKDTNNKIEENTVLEKKGMIIVETAKIRSSASTKSDIVGFLDEFDKVTIISQEGNWYKITSEKQSGYVNKELVKIIDEDQQVTSRSLTEERTVDKNIFEEIVNYSKKYLGYPYVSGGKNPEIGFDCSGFTKYVFSNFGYDIGNTSSEQANFGEEISFDKLQIGDLIIFYNEQKTGVGHTGIYIGNQEFIHAANQSRGVVIDNLNTNTYYNTRFINARRIMNLGAEGEEN